MSEHPIIFSVEMVRAILDGRKTQTRRIIKPQPFGYRTCWSDDLVAGDIYIETDDSLWKACESRGRNKRAAGELTPVEVKCPYGKIGDRLWVRETWWDLGFWDKGEWFGRTASHKIGPKYASDFEPEGEIAKHKRNHLMCKWRKRPSIFMPKWFARIFLEITNIRVERVQDISLEDCKAEGISNDPTEDWRELFMELWDSLNAKRGYSWQTNPWVWVITFKRNIK